MNKKINDTKYNHPFKVDEDYFDHLENKISQRVTKQPRAWIIKVPKLAVASLLVIVTIGVTVFFDLHNNTQYFDALADISEEEIWLYLDSNEISTEELLSLLSEPKSFSLDLEKEMIDQLDFAPSEEDMINDFYGLDEI